MKDCSQINIKYGTIDIDDANFARWRFDHLTYLIQSVSQHISVSNVKIWYDGICGYHILSFETQNNKILIKYDKGFFVYINSIYTFACSNSSENLPNRQKEIQLQNILPKLVEILVRIPNELQVHDAVLG